MPYSYLLYQENVMALLVLAGIPEKDSYDVIKAISKKKIKVINDSKNAFMNGIVSKLVEQYSISKQEAIVKTETMWQIIEDSSRYSFNASHAFCVAIDSLYGAYLKANYPIEFYEVYLEFYSEKKRADKTSKAIHEMKKYKDIKLGELKFGNDNRKYTANNEENVIYSSLKGVKYINDEVKEYLWFLSNINNTETKYENFIDLYKHLKYKLNKRHIETLIKIGYFKDFGKQLKLIKWISYVENVFANKQYKFQNLPQNLLSFILQFSNRQTEKTIYVEEEDTEKMHKKLFEIMPETEYSFVERVKHEVEFVGELLSEIPDGMTVGVVMAVSQKNKSFMFKSWKNGKELWIRVEQSKHLPKKESVVLLYNIDARQGKYNRMDYFAEVEVIKEA